MTQDEQHLRLLSIFHYVVGGVMALFACFPLIHVAVGSMFVWGMRGGLGDDAAFGSVFGWVFVAMGSLLFLAGQSLAGCMIASGRFLSVRRNYTFSLVVAGVECIFMPFGTVLGVFTLVVLMKDSVKALYAEGPLL